MSSGACSPSTAASSRLPDPRGTSDKGQLSGWGGKRDIIDIASLRADKPRGHARKRLMQAAWGLSKCYSVMSPFPFFRTFDDDPEANVRRRLVRHAHPPVECLGSRRQREERSPAKH